MVDVAVDAAIVLVAAVLVADVLVVAVVVGAVSRRSAADPVADLVTGAAG